MSFQDHRFIITRNYPPLDLTESHEIRLEKAIENVKLKNMSGYAAASYFQVPKSTIFARLKSLSGDDDLKELINPKITLSQMEIIYNYLNIKTKYFSPVLRHELLDIATQIARENKTIDMDEKIPDSWLKLFKKRFPDALIRRPNETVDRGPINNTIPWLFLKENFTDIGKYMSSNQYLLSDVHIIDDQSFQLFGQPPKFNSTNNNNPPLSFEAHFTVLSHCSADGLYFPPRIIWPVAFSQSLQIEDLPCDAQISSSMSGDMDESYMTAFILDIVERRIKNFASAGIAPRRQLLILESNSIYLSYQAFAALSENKWDIIQLPLPIMPVLQNSYLNIHSELYREIEAEKLRVVVPLNIQTSALDPRSPIVICQWGKLFTTAFLRAMSTQVISSSFQFIYPWESEKYNVKYVLFKLQQIGRQGAVLGSPYVPLTFFGDNLLASVVPPPIIRPIYTLLDSQNDGDDLSNKKRATKKRKIEGHIDDNSNSTGQAGEPLQKSIATSPLASHHGNNSFMTGNNLNNNLSNNLNNNLNNSLNGNLNNNINSSIELAKIWNPFANPLPLLPTLPLPSMNMSNNLNFNTFMPALPLPPLPDPSFLDPSLLTVPALPEEAKDSIIAYLVKLCQMQQTQIQNLQSNLDLINKPM